MKVLETDTSENLESRYIFLKKTFSEEATSDDETRSKQSKKNLIKLDKMYSVLSEYFRNKEFYIKSMSPVEPVSASVFNSESPENIRYLNDDIGYDSIVEKIEDILKLEEDFSEKGLCIDKFNVQISDKITLQIKYKNQEMMNSDFKSSNNFKVKDLNNKNLSAKSEIKYEVDKQRGNAVNIDWVKVFAPLESKVALGLIISFFLPWFAFGPISASGFSIPGAVKDLSSFGSSFGSTFSNFKIISLYSLYLIPIFSGISIYRLYKNQKTIVSSSVSSIVAVLSIVEAFYMMGTDFFDVVSFGYVFSVVLSLVLLFVVYDLKEKIQK